MRTGAVWLRITYVLIGLLLIAKIQLDAKSMEASVIYYYLLATQAFPVGFLLAGLPHLIRAFDVPMTLASRITDYLTLVLGYLQWFYFFPWLSHRVDRWMEARAGRS